MFENFSLAPFLVLDVLFACGIIIGSLAFMFTIGKYSVIPTFCAVAFGAVFATIGLFVDVIPTLNTLPAYEQRTIGFLVIAIILYFIFRSHSYFEPTVMPSMMESVICGVVLAGFVLAVIGSFLPADVIATLTPNIRFVFVSPIARTIWLLSPGIAFLGMRG